MISPWKIRIERENLCPESLEVFKISSNVSNQNEDIKWKLLLL